MGCAMKASRWAGAPYLVWMVLFTVVPLVIVVWYALTNGDGRFTLENLTQQRYASVFARSLLLAAHCHGHLPGHGVPGGLFSLPPAGEQAAHHADAGHAAHVDELSAAHLRMDGPAQRQRPGQQAVGPVRPWPL